MTSPAYELGQRLAWDQTGGAVFDASNSPYPRGSEEARDYYAGYRDGQRQIAEHRSQSAVAAPSAPTAVQGELL